MNINIFILIANDSLILSIYFSKNEPKSDRVCLIHSSGSEVLSSFQWHHSQLFDEFGVSDSSPPSNKFDNFCHCVVCASKHMMVLFLIFLKFNFFTFSNFQNKKEKKVFWLFCFFRKFFQRKIFFLFLTFFFSAKPSRW